MIEQDIQHQLWPSSGFLTDMFLCVSFLDGDLVGLSEKYFYNTEKLHPVCGHFPRSYLYMHCHLENPQYLLVAIHQRLKALHHYLERLHRIMEEIHEGMEELHRAVETLHGAKEVLPERMEVIHQFIEQLHDKRRSLAGWSTRLNCK